MRVNHLILSMALALPAVGFAKDLETSLPIRLIRDGGTIRMGSASLNYAWDNRGECLEYKSSEWMRAEEDVCAPYIYAQLSDGNCYAFNGYGVRRHQANPSQCAENYVSHDEAGRCVEHLFRPTFMVNIVTDFSRCAGTM